MKQSPLGGKICTHLINTICLHELQFRIQSFIYTNPPSTIQNVNLSNSDNKFCWIYSSLSVCHFGIRKQFFVNSLKIMSSFSWFIFDIHFYDLFGNLLVYSLVVRFKAENFLIKIFPLLIYVLFITHMAIKFN